MSDESHTDAPEKAAEAKQPVVDLSSLKDLSFGPAWTTGKPAPSHTRFEGERHEGRSGAYGDRRTDRRPPRPPRREFSQNAPRPEGQGQPRPGDDRPYPPRAPQGERRFAPQGGDRRSSAPQGERRSFAPQGERRGFAPYARANAAPIFNPSVDVLFYPEDSAFRALTKAIRNACRTYELFEVAQLILEKPERFVAVIKPLPAQGEGVSKLYQSVPDGLVFESEEAAVSHVCQNHLERFFTVETVTIDAPKGTFAGVSKCTLSGEFIAPPNYHRYQELLRAHHAERYPTMSFERFASNIELDKDPESVNAWLAKMTQTTRYTDKNAAEGETATSCDGQVSARAYLLSRYKDKIVKETSEARISGRQIEQLPQGNLRRSIEFLLEHQRRFPLATANNLRGRLRRMKFGLYKRGAKGISYVCAVKRRFRDEHTVFAQNLQDLIVFIEKNPNIYAKDLPEKFLGIVPPAPAAPAPVSESAPSAEASAESAPSAEAIPAPAAAPVLDPNAARITSLLKDLHWLVSEGYVTEYGDGRLFTPPPMPAAKVKQAEAEEEKNHGAAAEDIEEEPSTEEIAAPAEELPAPAAQAPVADPQDDLSVQKEQQQ